MNLKQDKLLNFLSKIIFTLYLILLIWVVIFKCNLIENIKLTYEYLKGQTLSERFTIFLKPFNDYYEGPFISQWKNTLKDDLLNVIVFLPFGLYISYFIKTSKFIKTLLIAILFSLGVEIFQLFSSIGSFSSKDLITNTLGGIIGYILYRIIYKKNNIRIMILNIISIIFIVLILPIVIYALINTIKNIEFYINILKEVL